MATNRAYAKGDQLAVTTTAAPNDPVESGDPVLYGERPGVAVTDEHDDGTVTVQFDGVFDLEVIGTSDDGTTDAAISAGDIIYYDTDDTLNVDSSNGTRFGYANADVAGGATSTVEVIVGY